MSILNIQIVSNNKIESKACVEMLKSCNHFTYNIYESMNLADSYSSLNSNNIDLFLLSTTILEDLVDINTIDRLYKKYPSLKKILIIDSTNNRIHNYNNNDSYDFINLNEITIERLSKKIFEFTKDIKRQDTNGLSENFFRSVIDSIEEAVAVLDEKGFIIYVNKAWCSFADQNKSLMNNYGLGLNYIDVANVVEGKDNTGRLAAEAIRDIIDGRISDYSIEYPCHSPDEKRWFELNISSFEENGLIRVVTTHKNITLRKESQIAKEKSDKVFEYSIDMLCIAGFDGYFKHLNPAWERVLGWSKEELLTKPWCEFVHPADIESTNNIASTIKDGIECYKFTNRYRCKDGTYKWLEWNTFPYKEEDLMFGVARDITDKKRMEQELIKSKNEAEKSDRLKSEFLSQISHEIRTPLNSLLGFASLIKMELKDSLSEDLKDSFIHLNNAGKRIFRTIDLLVNISEVQTGTYDIEYTDTDLVELLEEVIGEFRKEAVGKNLDLKLFSSVDNSNIIVDRASVYKIFYHLIDNAIKYTNYGGVKVTIKNTTLNSLIVSVTDTGIGISKQFIGSIFKLFSQEGTGYSRRYDGTGLGLNLVKAYCDLNRAGIYVSSEKGVGSNFTVIFK